MPATLSPLTGTQLGLDLKERGLDSVEASGDFVARLRAELAAWSRIHGSVTNDDARRLAEDLGLAAPSRYHWGGVFRKGWRQVGWKLSEVPSNHGRVNRVWILEDAP